jgi:hypothetical protein
VCWSPGPARQSDETRVYMSFLTLYHMLLHPHCTHFKPPKVLVSVGMCCSSSWFFFHTFLLVFAKAYPHSVFCSPFWTLSLSSPLLPFFFFFFHLSISHLH